MTIDIITKDLHLNTKGLSDIYNLNSKVNSVNKETGLAMDFATFMGPGITVPIQNGKCTLGIWQEIVSWFMINNPGDAMLWFKTKQPESVDSENLRMRP